MKLTKEYLQEIFEYKANGTFVSKKETSNGKRPVGAIIKAYIQRDGYLKTSIGDKNFAYHRLVFLYHHGFLPRNIDHINRNKADNRIENLREATASQNMLNVEKFKKNASSKFKGVSLHKEMGKYISHIRHRGRLIHLGYFEKEKEAAVAYDKKAKELFGNFAYLNFP